MMITNRLFEWVTPLKFYVYHVAIRKKRHTFFGENEDFCLFLANILVAMRSLDERIHDNYYVYA